MRVFRSNMLVTVGSKVCFLHIRVLYWFWVRGIVPGCDLDEDGEEKYKDPGLVPDLIYINGSNLDKDRENEGLGCQGDVSSVGGAGQV